jgi:hypothetical protein
VRIFAVFATIRCDDIVAEVQLIDGTTSQAAPARFGKPPRVWTSRDTATRAQTS